MVGHSFCFLSSNPKGTTVDKTQPLPFCNNKQIMNIKSMFDPQTKVTCVVVQWFFYSMYVAVMKMKCIGSNMKFLIILSECFIFGLWVHILFVYQQGADHKAVYRISLQSLRWSVRCCDEPSQRIQRSGEHPPPLAAASADTSLLIILFECVSKIVHP